jgi:hypothetical protein
MVIVNLPTIPKTKDLVRLLPSKFNIFLYLRRGIKIIFSAEFVLNIDNMTYLVSVLLSVMHIKKIC